MKMISKVEIKVLYATASASGLVGRDHDDDLHLIIYNMFKKESVKELTENQYKKVLRYIQNLTNDTKNGMITDKQVEYITNLMRQLVDINPNEYTPQERLAGIVHKHFGISKYPQEPLVWVNKEQGSKLIIILKDYIKYEKKKIERNEASDKPKHNHP